MGRAHTLCHHVRTQQEGGHLQVRKGALTRDSIDWHLDFGLPRTEDEVLWLRPPSLCLLVRAAQAIVWDGSGYTSTSAGDQALFSGGVFLRYHITSVLVSSCWPHCHL